MNCLFVLEIKPLLVTSFVNVFSRSIGCFSILFMVSFPAEACKFAYVPFVYFCFYFFHLERLT